jgi:hypothetical protein
MQSSDAIHELETPVPCNDRALSIVEQRTSSRRNGRSWLRRLGLAGFLFFFIKGLLWVVVSILAAKAAIEL